MITDISFTDKTSVDTQFSSNDIRTSIDPIGSDTAVEIDFSSDSKFTAEFLGYVGGGECKVVYATTAYWNAHRDTKTKRGYIYIYSDWKVDEQGRYISGLKIGDGNNFLQNLPFTDGMLMDHIYDTIVHVTAEERAFWNNKTSASYDKDTSTLIFSTGQNGGRHG